MIHINTCPVCDGTTFAPYITTQDYSVSQESFTIKQCKSCHFLITSPRPSDDQLGRYYQSDNYISHADRPRTMVDRIYWLARQIALRTKYNLVQQTSPKTLLDYGCGTGTFLSYCQTRGMAVTGVEPSAQAREIAAGKITPSQVHESITPLTGTYDIITLWHVLEHVPELNNTITQLKKVLQSDGTLVIAVPNVTTWESTIYKTHWAAFDVPRHLWHFNKNTITQLFQRHEMTLTQIKPMRLDSFYVSLLSEKYRRPHNMVPFGMINAAKNGLISNLKARKTGAYSSLIYIFQHA